MTGPKDEEPDRDRRDRAEDAAEDESELAPDDVEQRFDAIVANYDDKPQWPEETVEEEIAEESPIDDDKEEPTLLELLDAEDPDDADAEYVPPPPPPFPRPSVPAVLAMVLIAAGLTLVVSPGLLDVGETLGRLTGIAGFLGGAAMLVWRLRPEEPEEAEPDDENDNGAVT
ncbi:MAG: hypothetical protein ACRDXX_09105 [Stackebrandtia sp.]